MKKQLGMSIIECLLAIAFATALIWQVFVLYQDIHQTHRLQTAMSRLLHHGQWFEDVMGERVRSAGDMACVPASKQVALNKQVVQAYVANQVPAEWGIHAAKQTDVLILGSCQLQTGQAKAQWVQTAYYLKTNTANHLYTLYQKQKSSRAMAMQDDIQSLQWLLAFHTKQQGVLTAPQEVGVSNEDSVGAIAWKVVFASPNNVLVKLNKPLIRIFYGYMSLHK